MNVLWEVLRRWVHGFLEESRPLILAMDDTILRKTGKKIPGTKYLRDPLSPHFHPNFVWGQRWIQLCAVISEHLTVRSIPLAFKHAPVPRKPGKRASGEEFAEYQQAAEKARLCRVGRELVTEFREQLDQDGAAERTIWITVDGSYTNKEVLRALPSRTVLIGRMRKDAALHYEPVSQPGVGRRRVYGETAPTPEQWRQDEAVPWSSASIVAAGKRHEMDFKELGPVKCRTFGADCVFRVIVLRPLAYRPRKGSRLLYRQPAYLLCTDLSIPAQEIIQAYCYRWEIEVTFRDEKQLLGISQAQVRSRESVEIWPGFVAATYGMLQVASIESAGVSGFASGLSVPRWYSSHRPRGTTRDFIRVLRQEIWGRMIRCGSFSGFAAKGLFARSREKLARQVGPAIFYAA